MVKLSSLFFPIMGHKKKMVFSIETKVQCFEIFRAVIYKFSLKARVFVLGKSFQPSLMFVGKARTYLRGAP